jgi:hypothetical protein
MAAICALRSLEIAPIIARSGRFPAFPKGARERQDSTMKRTLERRTGRRAESGDRSLQQRPVLW